MRTEAELTSMSRHPSLTTAAVADAVGFVERPTGSPYRRFFDALEDLSYARELHGPGSLEARIALKRVEAARTEAAQTWWDGGTAA